MSHQVRASSRQAWSSYAVRRTSTDADMSSAKCGFTFRVKGSARVMAKANGRGVTCGHTWAPRAQPARLSSTMRLWLPVGIESSAVMVNGTPVAICRS